MTLPTTIPFNNYMVYMAEGKSICNICMKQFSKESQLRLHLNIHFFEQPFRCDLCAVSFRTKGLLQKHSYSTSHWDKLKMNKNPDMDNQRPFKCLDCKRAFRIHGHLAKHLRSKIHIMKLECLGKLPFGLCAQMERRNMQSINTLDCDTALESLKSLARRLNNSPQMCSNDVPIVPSKTTINVQLSQSHSTPPLPVQQVVSSSYGNIVSTRSNTCQICCKLFKAPKFLQVHLYSDHPETVLD